MPEFMPADLTDRLRAGDFKLFELIFNTYWEELYTYAAKVTGSEEDARDIIQDLFTSIWERREQLELHSHIRFYLFSAVRKQILRKFRNDGLEEKHLQKFITHSELRAELTLNTLIHKDIMNQLQQDLQQLPEKERQVFEWYHFDELSIREIAMMHGTAEQTVRNQLGSAYKKARPLLNRLLMLL